MKSDEARNEIEFYTSSVPVGKVFKRLLYEDIERGDAEGFLKKYTAFLEYLEKYRDKEERF